MGHANNRTKYYFGMDQVRKLTLLAATRDSLETYYQDGSIHCQRARALRAAKRNAKRTPRDTWFSRRARR